MHVWLAMDPETDRVVMQDREFDDGNFPRGRRGRDWARREADIDEDQWARLLAGQLPPDEQDQLHQETWTKSGETAWPNR